MAAEGRLLPALTDPQVMLCSSALGAGADTEKGLLHKTSPALLGICALCCGVAQCLLVPLLQAHCELGDRVAFSL